MATAEKQGADLDKVTDHVEESVAEKAVDAGKAQQAVASFRSGRKVLTADQVQRERELAAVQVSKEDVAVLAEELEVTNQVADRILREAKGVLVDAMRQAISQ